MQCNIHFSINTFQFPDYLSIDINFYLFQHLKNKPEVDTSIILNIS